MTASFRGPAAHVFGVPAILGAITAFGLVLALIEDGMWDRAAPLALAVPLAVIAWKIARARANFAQRTDLPSRRGL
jgi:hypothetical protein